MAGLKAAIWLQDDPLIGVSMLKMVADRDGKTWKTRGYSAREVFPLALGEFSKTLNTRFDVNSIVMFISGLLCMANVAYFCAIQVLSIQA